MPILQKLVISDFRNITQANLVFGTDLNIITGDNGAGKSSVLEAINVLAHGKSNRTHKYQRLLQHEKPSFTLFGEVAEVGELETKNKLGISRQRKGDYSLKLNGESVKSAAKLANVLPIILIDSESFQLFEGSAKDRRKLFDWLVFHVKPTYGELWQKSNHCIKQRNAMLRQFTKSKIPHSEALDLLRPWNNELALIGAQIEALRLDVFSVFEKVFQSICDCKALALPDVETETGKFKELDLSQLKSIQASNVSFDLNSVSLVYKNGWRIKEEEFIDCRSFDNLIDIEKLASLIVTKLDDSLERDLKMGYGHLGPHKSDLNVSVGGIPTHEMLSRGQLKVLVTLLKMTKAFVYAQETNKRPLFLIDDLPSELDKKHQELLKHWLKIIGMQVFVTGVSQDSLKNFIDDSDSLNSYSLFHVKQGSIEQLMFHQ